VAIAVPHRIKDHAQGERLLASAGIVDVISREGRAPISQYPLKLSLLDVI
jgi:hypothetical protein